MLLLEKVKPGGLRALAAYVLREGAHQLPGSAANTRLAGAETAADAVDAFEAALLDAGICTLRRDAVAAVHVVVSPPPGADLDDAFARSLPWLAEQFGRVLVASIHRDQSQPHLHALLMPLKAGRMNGSAAVGSPRQLCALRGRFADEVLGRRRGDAGAARVRLVDGLALALVGRGAAADALRACLERAPLDELRELAERVGLEGAVTFAGIMTRPQSGERQADRETLADPALGFADAAPAPACDEQPEQRQPPTQPADTGGEERESLSCRLPPPSDAAPGKAAPHRGLVATFRAAVPRAAGHRGRRARRFELRPVAAAARRVAGAVQPTGP